MSRLIDADILLEYLTILPIDLGYREVEEIEEYVKGMPTIEERKKGEWIEDGYNHYKAVCSECGEPCGTYVMGKPRDNFCKWCGADMRKGEGK